jgi:hypothetical protein
VTFFAGRCRRSEKRRPAGEDWEAVGTLGAIGPDAKAAISALKALQDDKDLGASAKAALMKIEQ